MLTYIHACMHACVCACVRTYMHACILCEILKLYDMKFIASYLIPLHTRLILGMLQKQCQFIYIVAPHPQNIVSSKQYLLVHVNPSPAKPVLHVHLYDPSLLVHLAWLSQSCPVVHSSMSEINRSFVLPLPKHTR